MKNKKTLTSFLTRTSLANAHPNLIREWHPTKNKPMTCNDITSGSHRKIWWRCATVNTHEWQATCKDRALKKSGCPFCSGRLVSVETSLAKTRPDLAEEWHPTKNESLTPQKLVAGSCKKIWWQCSQNSSHEWQASCTNRSIKKSGCPFCSGRNVLPLNSLAALYPQLASEWHPYKNDSLVPDNISVGSGRRVWWRCSESHEWQTSCNNRTSNNKTGCPLCIHKK